MPRNRRGARRGTFYGNRRQRINNVNKVINANQNGNSNLVSSDISSLTPNDNISNEVTPCQNVTSVPCDQFDPCPSTSVPSSLQVNDASPNTVRIVPFHNSFSVIPLTGNSVFKITVSDIDHQVTAVNKIITASSVGCETFTSASDSGENVVKADVPTTCNVSSLNDVESVEMLNLTQPSTSSHQSFNLPDGVVKEEIVILDDGSDTEENNSNIVNEEKKNEDESKEQSSQLSQNKCSPSNETPECPVCLQPYVHPARLPCGHIFCYLCLKGISLSHQPCPMCRAPVPLYHRDNPPLLSVVSSSPQKCDVKLERKDEEKYFWFYEGRHGGWWQFEERMSDEIEENHNCGRTKFDMMICGQLYTIDTISCVQHPKHIPFRLRKIRRDLPSKVYLKGVAGILQRNLPSTSKQ